MKARTRTSLLGVSSLLLASAAGAGLLDSPPPAFHGVPGQVVYRMGPIYYQPGLVDTGVTCTNLDGAAAGVAIEVFDGGDYPSGTLTEVEVAVGGLVTFVTSPDGAGASGVLIRNLPPLEDGKARLSATTTKLSCTAYHRMRSADGTMQERALELVKKVR